MIGQVARFLLPVRLLLAPLPDKAKVFTMRSLSISVIRSGSSGRLFTEKHEWITVSGNVGTVGISKYAQEALGDIVFAQLPDPGSEVQQGVECGVVESVKAASDVYSPISGKVTEKNDAVEKEPSLINKACYTDGWMFKVELQESVKEKELSSLMNEQKYEEFLKTLEH